MRQEKEGELTTTSLEFEYPHRKSPCKMLISGDDICNDVITLCMCFSMFVYILAHFYYTLIGGNLTAQPTGSHRGIGGGIRFHRHNCKLSFLFPPCCQRAPENLLAGYQVGPVS